MTENKQRFYEIDLLRFLAAFSVVVFHYAFRGSAEEQPNPVSYPLLEPVVKYGYLGVELFFIISGYVVLMSAQTKTVRQFFVSRVVRLYPAFWVACTATFIVVSWWGPPLNGPYWSTKMAVNPVQYLVNMTMLQHFAGCQDIDGVYWTLAYEIRFYVLIALVLALRLMHRLPLLIAGWLFYGIMVAVDLDFRPLSAVLFPSFSPLFIAGMLFYLLQQRLFNPWLLYLLMGISWALAMQNALVFADGQAYYYHSRFSPVIVASAVSVFYLVFWLIVRRSFAFQPCSWLAWLGALTYPLYLIHQHIGYILFQRLGGKVDAYGLLVGIVALMLLLAYCLYRFIERPFANRLRLTLHQLMS